MAVRKFFHKSTFNIHLDICYVIRFDFTPSILHQIISFPFHLDIWLGSSCCLFGRFVLQISQLEVGILFSFFQFPFLHQSCFPLETSIPQLTSSHPQVRRLSPSSCNTWFCRNWWKILESLLVEGSKQQDTQYKNNHHHEFLLNILQPEHLHFPRWGSSPILIWNCLMTSHSSPPHWRTCSISCRNMSPPRSEAAMNITLSGCAILTLRARCLYFERCEYFVKRQIYLMFVYITLV